MDNPQRLTYKTESTAKQQDLQYFTASVSNTRGSVTLQLIRTEGTPAPLVVEVTVPRFEPEGSEAHLYRRGLDWDY